MSEQKDITRREMLRSAGRYIALGGLVLGVGQLVGEGQDDVCESEKRCSRCGALADCRLPEGIAARLGQLTG